MDDKQKENKGLTPPVSNKKVKVRISKGRAITGYGKAGDEVDMPEELAKQYEKDGYVQILKKGE